MKKRFVLIVGSLSGCGCLIITFATSYIILKNQFGRCKFGERVYFSDTVHETCDTWGKKPDPDTTFDYISQPTNTQNTIDDIKIAVGNSQLVNHQYETRIWIFIKNGENSTKIVKKGDKIPLKESVYINVINVNSNGIYYNISQD